MRKSLWIIPTLLLFAAIGAPTALATTVTDGTLNFTLINGTPTPTGSFVFDNTTSTFTSFVVNWNGSLLDFGPRANYIQTTQQDLFALLPTYYTDSFQTCDITWPYPQYDCYDGAAGIFFLFSTLRVEDLLAVNTTFSPTIVPSYALGNWSVSETVIVTPEPGTAVLWLTGIGLMIVMARKRVGHGLPQTS
jgi:hypothetical protein